MSPTTVTTKKSNLLTVVGIAIVITAVGILVYYFIVTTSSQCTSAPLQYGVRYYLDQYEGVEIFGTLYIYNKEGGYLLLHFDENNLTLSQYP